MIRRDVWLTDGSPAWALISQIEHARISASLASHCLPSFSSTPERAGSSPTPANHAQHPLPQEILTAIERHDDGWAEWERSPRLDPQLGRPLSFTELDAAEAVAIWDKSIDAAAEIGALAATMVAGHFLRLLAHSDHLRRDAPCDAWRRRTADRRDAWLDQWQALDPARHTPAVAAEALQWLWTFDEISLWLCLNCPAAGESDRTPAATYLAGRATNLEMKLSAAAGQGGVALARPWRFDAASIDVGVAGLVAPARRYASSQQLLAAARPCRLDWRLSNEV